MTDPIPTDPTVLLPQVGTTSPKPGVLTTEFYATLVPLIACCIAGIVLIWKGEYDRGQTLLITATGGGTAYGALRSFVKR